MKKYVVFGLAAVFLSQGALAKEAPPPPEPPTQPDWSEVRLASEARLKSALFDPSSAQIQWTRGFRWGYFKPILSKKVWGWTGCGTVNAKNRMGGYVGTTAFVAVYDGGVKLTLIDDNQLPYIGSACANGTFPPVQSAFLDVVSPPAGPSSVADEIGKLAALRDKGIITQDEFVSQKAKLLHP